MVFIYLKEDTVKVLDLEDAKRLANQMIDDGWKHIVTLNSAIWIQMLLNLTDVEDIIAEVRELKTIHF